MNNYKLFTLKCLLTFGALFTTGSLLAASQPDFAKEQRWAEQIVDFLIDGEAVWLTHNKHKFLGIYTEAETDQPRGAVIIVHGQGIHPDWQQVIQPLRISLPTKGWATLAVQMPVLANGVENNEYVSIFPYVTERIQGAVAYLHKQGFKHIALAGHSMGAAMASYYLATTQDSNIEAFVGVGMKGVQQPDQYRVLDNVKHLLKIKIPVLDIYGSNTNKEILGSVERRADALRSAGNKKSRQDIVQGADHFFEKYETQLSKQVSTWLDSVFVNATAQQTSPLTTAINKQ